MAAEAFGALLPVRRAVTVTAGVRELTTGYGQAEGARTRPSRPKGIAVLLAVDFDQGLQDAWSDIATFLPKLVGFLVVLVIGVIIAKAVSRAVAALAERVGFNRAVERGGISRALAKADYDAADVLAKIVYYALLLFVAQFAFGLFGDNAVSALLASMVAFLPRLFVALVIVVVTMAIARGVREIVASSLGGLDYGRTLASVAWAAVVVIGIFAALDQLQIAPTIVQGLFYAMLAVLAGSAIIAIGGGGIQPMRQRWERSLSRYDTEKERVRTELRNREDELDLREREARSSEATTTALDPSLTGRRGRGGRGEPAP